MSNACTPILVGVASTVSEILVLSKMAKFLFLTMDYSPWSPKYLINWNQLKKFMQVWIDVKCRYIDFGGRDLYGFGDILVLSKTAKFPLLTMDYSPWSPKNLINWNQLKKFMQGLMSNACTPILVGVASTVSEIMILSKWPTKIGVHAFDINPYLHEFFELIPIY